MPVLCAPSGVAIPRERKYDSAMKLRCVFALLLSLPLASSAFGEVIIESVIASVDGAPITLVDIEKRLSPPRQISLSDLQNDSDVRATVDQVILERLITAEAESRRITTTDEDIDRYIDAVASQNQMDRADFGKALTSQGRTLESYRTQVKTEILKSRIVTSHIQAGIGVTQKQIQSYIESHPELARSGEGVRLRRLVLKSEGKSPDEIAQKLKEIREKLDDGEDFEDLAAAYSDASDAADGGDLGVLTVADLSRDVFEAVLPLAEGEVSAPVTMENETLLFFVDEKIEGEDPMKDEALVTKVREHLERIQLEERIETFFKNDIYKLHAVDKKV